MLPTRIFSVLPFAGVLAAILGWTPTAQGRPPLAAEGKALYAPIQSISYELGSKFMSGYFVQRDAICLVTLMVAEKADPEQNPPLSPARVRLALSPGQVAGLDSEEGKSLNLTCCESAATLLVQIGDREKLFALQTAPNTPSVCGVR